MPNGWLPVSLAAAMAGINVKQAHYRIRSRRLPVVHIGRSVFVHADDLATVSMRPQGRPRRHEPRRFSLS